MRRPVTVAKYLDITEAQLARVRLGGEGIESFVIEGAGFNPLLTGAVGGVQLQVRERDLDRAREILAEVLPDTEDEADLEAAPGGERVVRCPRCELEYCYHERVPGTLTEKRWHCRKCEHVWDNPDEGPKKMTRLEPGDPKPVFRLRRGRAGTGLFLGLMAGFFGTLVMASLVGRIDEDARIFAVLGSALLVFGVPVLGWRIGKSVRADVCSVPECRTPLSPEVEECPGCKGTIAGIIASAPEHFSAAADVRRELATSRQKELSRKKKKKKVPIEPAAPAL